MDVATDRAGKPIDPVFGRLASFTVFICTAQKLLEKHLFKHFSAIFL